MLYPSYASYQILGYLLNRRADERMEGEKRGIAGPDGHFYRVNRELPFNIVIVRWCMVSDLDALISKLL
jgi:hypothetical protein